MKKILLICCFAVFAVGCGYEGESRSKVLKDYDVTVIDVAKIPNCENEFIVKRKDGKIVHVIVWQRSKNEETVLFDN